MLKLNFASIFCMMLLASCGGDVVKDNRNANSKSAVEAGGQSEKDLEKDLEDVLKEEQRMLKEEAASKTIMSFDRKFHDFGDVEQGVENTTTFIVTNRGSKPLIIEDVAASCGCTTPEKPEKPILPGKSDKITVTFKAKPDQKNEIIKTVTVTANTNPIVEKLEIRAFVK